MTKRIIHQLSLSDIGGVQRSFSTFILYAVKKSTFKHYVYSMHDLIDNFVNIKDYHFNINRSLIFKLKFIFSLISRNCVIHFYNNLGSYSLNRLLKYIPHTNIIFHERGSAWNAKNLNIEIYRSNAIKAKIILSNSNATKRMLVKRFGIDRNKIKVIYNGFLSKDYKPTTKNINRYSKKISVGYVGRLDTPKGVHVFIQSAKNLPEYDFFIAGRGVLEHILKESAKDFKNIHFLGSIKDPLDFILKMDIIVVPSIREPLGNVIIEAGYCKKPVIASNIDGIPEIITNGVNGILIDPDKKISFEKIPNKAVPLPKMVINPKTFELQKPKEIDFLKLNKSIIHLATNLNLREKYGENLYKTVKKKFNIENYYKELDKIYKDLLKN